MLHSVMNVCEVMNALLCFTIDRSYLLALVRAIERSLFKNTKATLISIDMR